MYKQPQDDSHEDQDHTHQHQDTVHKTNLFLLSTVICYDEHLSPDCMNLEKNTLSLYVTWLEKETFAILTFMTSKI